MLPAVETLLTIAFGAAFLIVAAQSIYTGLVRWRGGSVAATRKDNPMAFWLVIALYLFLGCSILMRAL